MLSTSCAGAQVENTPAPLKEVPVAATLEIVPTAVVVHENTHLSRTVNAVMGGEILLSSPGGDTVQLSIPPFALSEDTEITLTTLSVPPGNPFQQYFFAGVSIEPAGLSLRVPATLSVTLATHQVMPGERIFFLKSSELAFPLWQSQVDDRRLSGKISHFSEYIGGSPSADEAQSQATAAGELGGDFPDGWKDSLEGTQALSEWGNGLNDMGLGDGASAAIDKARQRLIEDLECLMDLNCAPPRPLDPCGDYLQMLLQYYEQANLLAIDPESEMMQYLYDLLQQVLNECTNRYTLEYAHDLKVNQGGLEENIVVTGKVIFTAPIYGVFELGEPLKVTGAGPVDVTISGEITSDDETCILSGTSSNDVTISGEFEADEMGDPWLALEVSERWYTTGSLTVTCPDGDAQSVPLPSISNQSFPLRFQYQDGAKSMAPNLGGMQGEYVWILHILHSW